MLYYFFAATPTHKLLHFSGKATKGSKPENSQRPLFLLYQALPMALWNPVGSVLLVSPKFRFIYQAAR